MFISQHFCVLCFADESVTDGPSKRRFRSNYYNEAIILISVLDVSANRECHKIEANRRKILKMSSTISVPRLAAAANISPRCSLRVAFVSRGGGAEANGAFDLFSVACLSVELAGGKKGK